MKASYGIVGRKLSHSFSKDYFTKKFTENGLDDHSYSNFEIRTIEELPSIISANKDLKGFNVTNPYKEEVIKFLDQISEEAKAIGAVNCVKIENGMLKGYNTDVYGFSQSIKPFLDVNHQKALILGTGGAAKAVAFALTRIGVDHYFVTSSNIKKTDNTFFYKELNEFIIRSFKLIVNATPLGMYPDVLSYPDIPFSFVTNEHLCYDLIYNPEMTEFLKRSKEFGATTINGLSMLHLQAERSWEIWSENIHKN